MRASRLLRAISRLQNVLEVSIKAQIQGFDVNIFIKRQIEGLEVNFHNVFRKKYYF